MNQIEKMVGGDGDSRYHRDLAVLDESPLTVWQYLAQPPRFFSLNKFLFERSYPGHPHNLSGIHDQNTCDTPRAIPGELP